MYGTTPNKEPTTCQGCTMMHEPILATSVRALDAALAAALEDVALQFRAGEDAIHDLVISETSSGFHRDP